eukprot:4019090-Prymnesium_polylepis.1
MESGVDSLGAVELRNQLQGMAGQSVTLSSTLIFDHPTARQLVGLLQPAAGTRRVQAKRPVKVKAKKKKKAAATSLVSLEQ